MYILRPTRQLLLLQLLLQLSFYTFNVHLHLLTFTHTFTTVRFFIPSHISNLPSGISYFLSKVFPLQFHSERLLMTNFVFTCLKMFCFVSLLRFLKVVFRILIWQFPLQHLTVSLHSLLAFYISVHLTGSPSPLPHCLAAFNIFPLSLFLFVFCSFIITHLYEDLFLFNLFCLEFTAHLYPWAAVVHQFWENLSRYLWNIVDPWFLLFSPLGSKSNRCFWQFSLRAESIYILPGGISNVENNPGP